MIKLAFTLFFLASCGLNKIMVAEFKVSVEVREIHAVYFVEEKKNENRVFW